jgi:large subunit ribosomal protein L25
MSQTTVALNLQQRTVLGKGLNKLRHDGFLPGVVHDHGKPSVHVMGDLTEMNKAYVAAGKRHPIELQVGSKKYLALIKDAHIEPVKRQLMHIVFQAVDQNEMVEAEIPVDLLGEIPAVKAGLMVLHQLDVVQVQAFPGDLPDRLSVDGTKLVELGDKLTVADITPPAKVEILTEAEHPIATVVETPAVASEAAAEESAEGGAEAAEGAEGETSAAESESKEA